MILFVCSTGFQGNLLRSAETTTGALASKLETVRKFALLGKDGGDHGTTQAEALYECCKSYPAVATLAIRTRG
jgi:hypothetical protein